MPIKLTPLIQLVQWIVLTTLFIPVFQPLYVERWELLDYTHAYFILPIALWLAWRQIPQARIFIRDGQPTHSPVALLIALFGMWLLVFGWHHDYLIIRTLALIPMLWGLIQYTYGTAVVKLFTFPIGYLWLLVPPPLGILDTITLPMRHAASIGAHAVLQLLDYSVQREGLLLTLGQHEVFMGAPCSGFRSLITLFSLALVYIYLGQHLFRVKILLVLAIFPLVLLGNLLRIVILCLITFHFGHEAGQGFFHGFSGIIVFLVMIGGLLGLERVFKSKQGYTL